MAATSLVDAERSRTGLWREERGRQAFVAMYSSWIVRSGWSFKVLSDLCEAALRNTIAKDIPDFVPGTYRSGDLIVSDSIVWEAKDDLEASKAPSKSYKGESWERICVLRRFYPSQLHNLQIGSTKFVAATAFDVLGQLNLYLAALRSHNAKEPSDQRLAEKALQATVIEDADGPFGPEEMFAVYVGRLEPPFNAMQPTEEQANEMSRQLARKIRQGMMEAGLDLVDDWSQFVVAYPTTDRVRIAKIRDVALNQGQWSPEQVKDEAAAVEIALTRLKNKNDARIKPLEAQDRD